MRKSQEKEPGFKGGITAFLALLFVLMISLLGALVESASIQMTKNIKRTDTILALESTFAEYDKDMLEKYDLFVRNGCGIDVLKERLDYYGATNMTHRIVREERLTDYSGQPFYEQAVRYAKDWLGIDVSPGETKFELYSDSYLEEEELVHMELEERLAQEETGLPEEGNPLSAVSRLKNTNLLTLVCSNPEQISNQSIIIDNLPSGRELQTGNWGTKTNGGSADKFFLVAYLTEHFRCLTDTKPTDALCYEQEYLLCGYPSDRENLEQTCKWILSVRMAANYTYLLTDTTKQAEAEALSLTLCSLLTVPGIAEVVKHAILLAWAYGESVVDVRVLLKGKKVPAIKNSATWQLQLANLVKLGTAEESVSEIDTQDGLDYQSYVRGLLFMRDKESLSMRSLDMIESALKIRADECMTKVEIESKAVLRRGVKEAFSTKYEYQ